MSYEILNDNLYDWKSFIEAGIDPKTRRPIRWSNGDKRALKDKTLAFLRLVDEQDAVNRYVWNNLPCDITSQELERLLYYKGQLCFFRLPEYDDKYFFLPYALDGGIDFYGRFISVHPVAMSDGTTEASEDNKRAKAQSDYLSTVKLKCIYDEKEEVENPDCSCVLLHDYTKQISQTLTARSYVNAPLLEAMSECIPLMRTSLYLGTGIKGLRVTDADQAHSVKAANDSIERASLHGEPYIPIIGNLDFQELAPETTRKPEEYMIAMKSIDNLRLSGYGINNGGLFEKKAHELQSEADENGGPTGLILNDGLKIRQHFCDIANKVFGLDISVEVAPEAVEMGEMQQMDSESDYNVINQYGGSDDGNS